MCKAGVVLGSFIEFEYNEGIRSFLSGNLRIIDKCDFEKKILKIIDTCDF